MTTREEALRFIEDSRRTVPAPTDAVRVEDFRQQNLRLKLVPQSDDLLAILRKADQLLPDKPFPPDREI
jgi:hypothetical protein